MNNQYEYKMIPYEQEQMNSYGELGWEYYAMIAVNGQYHACFKRVTGDVIDGWSNKTV